MCRSRPGSAPQKNGKTFRTCWDQQLAEAIEALLFAEVPRPSSEELSDSASWQPNLLLIKQVIGVRQASPKSSAERRAAIVTSVISAVLPCFCCSGSICLDFYVGSNMINSKPALDQPQSPFKGAQTPFKEPKARLRMLRHHWGLGSAVVLIWWCLGSV